MVSLEDIGKAANAKPKHRAVLRKMGIVDAKSLLTPRGLKAVSDLKLAPKQERRLLGAAKLAMISGDIELTKMLVQKGFTSVNRLARTPFARLEKEAGKLTGQKIENLRQLHAKSRIVANAMHEVQINLNLRKSRGGKWLVEDSKDPILPDGVLDLLDEDAPDEELCASCDDCHTVFGPFAYIYDLIDFITDNWGLSLEQIEKILLQPVGEIDCESGLVAVLQIRLAIEVLEKFHALRDGFAGSEEWTSAYRDMGQVLLRVVDLSSEDVNSSSEYEELRAALERSGPDLGAVDNLLGHLRDHYSAQIHVGVSEDARAAHLAEFEARAATVVRPSLVTYRSALIDATQEEASVLANMLFIDLQNAPCRQTTHVSQIIQSLQSLILTVRTGEISVIKRDDAPTELDQLNPTAFDDKTWKWLQSYGTWSAAMYVLVYPENLLSSPTVRQLVSPGFRPLLDASISRGPAEDHDPHLIAYRQYLATIGSLQLASAHVVADKLYVFAHNGRCAEKLLWVNIMDRTSYEWEGWRSVDRSERDCCFVYDVGLVRPIAEDPVFIVAYRQENENSMTFDWLSLDMEFSHGALELEFPANRNIDDGHAFVQGYFVQEENATQFYVSFVKASTYDHAVWKSAKFDMIGPHVHWRDEDDPRRPQYPIRDQGDAIRYYSVENESSNTGDPRAVILSNGGYQWREANENVSARTMNEYNMGTVYELKEGKGRMPVYSYGKRVYILATNIYDTEAYLICATEISDSSLPNTLALSCYALELRAKEVKRGPEMLCSSLEQIDQAFTAYCENGDAVPLVVKHIYFDELFLHYPLLAIWSLNRRGDFVSANDWCRQLYDPLSHDGRRARFPFAERFSGGIVRAEDWLVDSQDPDSIARRRKGVYLRHTVLTMVKNLLDWADHEFSRENPESLNRAQELYELADTVLAAPDLKNPCEEQLQALKFEIRSRYESTRTSTTWRKETEALLGDLGRVNSRKICEEAVVELRSLVRRTDAPNHFHKKLRKIVANTIQEESRRKTRQRFDTTFSDLHAKEESLEDDILGTLYGNKEIPGKFGYKDSANRPEPSIVPSSEVFCIPENPLLVSISSQIAANLVKLRTCLNIAGEPISSVLLPVSSLEGGVFTDIGQIESAMTSQEITSPRYRYSYLAEKVRQQVDLALRLGAGLLAAMEKTDSVEYNQLLAENSLDVAGETVRLRELFKAEAEDAEDLALEQQERATEQFKFWDKRVGVNFWADLSDLEVGALLATAGLGAVAGGIAGGVSTGVATVGVPPTTVAGVVAGSAIGALLQSGGQIVSTIAAYERRHEEWELERKLAEYDVNIAEIQVTLASDRIDIARQEKSIAALQEGHSRSVVNFLANKRANRALYAWMIGELSHLYRSFMQIATSTALMAQRAIEFERQGLIGVINGDYWSINHHSLSREQRDSGILGAERLLRDLTRLDDYVLTTDRRRLEISKTISLSQMIPTDFAKFRETGRIEFNTLMDWFDWDFPGHYLRLIKNVKVTLVALTPPDDGIHAMLSNDGLSSVIVPNGGMFVKKRAARTFGESVALDSPYNDSGLFVLDYKDPMLLPFEGLGVETRWALELPKPTNRFNFETIADILFTVEYTAFHDGLYRGEVILRLGDNRETDIVLSLHRNFPDAWYKLKNPVDTSTGQKVKISVARNMLPPHLKHDVEVKHVSAVVSGMAEGETIELEIKKIAQTNVAVPLVTHPANAGFLSTRGNSVDRLSGTPINPVGEWQITFGPAVYDRGHGEPMIERITDVLLSLTVQGKVEWPP